jgi:DNA repair protein RecN (Recombination protein N)
VLTTLRIENFVIIDLVELHFDKGLSVITGETGAGKSIIIDALSLVLGGRADSSLIGPHKTKCDLSACFDIEQIPEAVAWLRTLEYGESPWQECIVRRIFQKDGKSRQMINGYSCTAQQLKEFTALLINIHSQNQQNFLTKRSQQRSLLDNFCNHASLLEEVKQKYGEWQETEKQLEQCKQLQDRKAEQELLEYQIDELEKLDILVGEYEQLDLEQRQLANANQLLANTQRALSTLVESDDINATNLLYQSQTLISEIQQYDNKLTSASELLNNAIVQLEEASNELRAFSHHIEINPERLVNVESRLAKIHELARKYQVKPFEVHTILTQLKKRHAEITSANLQSIHLSEKATTLLNAYQVLAQKLHKRRQKSAVYLNEQIIQYLLQLGISGGTFQIKVETTQNIGPYGADEIEFLVATNPGQPLQPVSKIASGGEISRIALAIYVVTAKQNTTPVLIFDEVDVGIGGATAAVVGSLLKSLSKTAQVLCITHLPQVAACGDSHYCVRKDIDDNQPATQILALNEEQRIAEVARMLGGLTITEKSLAHAKELVDSI